jgi:hypothetical protein
MVCRGLMPMLHRAGYIELPARRKNPLNPLVPRKKPAPVFIDLHPLQGSLSSSFDNDKRHFQFNESGHFYRSR